MVIKIWPHIYYGYLKKPHYFLKTLYRKLQYPFLKINMDPVIILGNQKSGTNAITSLLSQLTGKTRMLDSPGLCEPVQTQIHAGEIEFATYVYNNKDGFSKDIIKEPCLTFLFNKLDTFFKNPKYVFIVRDPRDNIRSILNRVEVPGHLEMINFNDYPKLNIQYQLLLDGRWLGLYGKNYIEMLAMRWNLAVDVYLNNHDRISLVRYEDFLRDKVGTIEKLAIDLGYKAVKDISDRVDIQYNFKGNSSVNLYDFFGEKNLKRIERICAERMKIFDYLPYGKTRR